MIFEQPPRYSIDTSAILDGWTRYYSPDVFPAVWSALEQLCGDGVIVAAAEVKVELERKQDEVLQWFKRHVRLVPLDTQIQLAAKEILSKHERLVVKGGRRSLADPFVIAVARVHGCTVVTGEPRRGRLDKPNIPDVCEALGVRWVNLLGMFRELGVRFSA